MLEVEAEVNSMHSHLEETKRLAEETELILKEEHARASRKPPSETLERFDRELQCIQTSRLALQNIEERLKNANLALPIKPSPVPHTDRAGEDSNSRMAQTTKGKDNNLCFSCGKRQRRWMFLPCNHLVLCDNCIGSFDYSWETCVVCEAPVEDTEQVFEG
jgi:hypothetical protein